MYEGMDLHKSYLQIAVTDNQIQLSCNLRINNDIESIDEFFEDVNSDVKVMESSSIPTVKRTRPKDILLCDIF